MNQYHERHQVPVAHPPSPAYSRPPPALDGGNGPYVVAPPPMGYPTKDAGDSQGHVPGRTTTRGDGFWKGCVAALCCCWCLDVCLC